MKLTLIIDDKPITFMSDEQATSAPTDSAPATETVAVEVTPETTTDQAVQVPAEPAAEDVTNG